MQITSAMKMVSAAKLKRAQDAIIQMRPYAAKMHDILTGLSGSLDMSENIFASKREIKNVLMIAISSNRGLCGGFNNNVIKETLRQIREEYTSKNISVLTVGKKATDSFKRTEYTISGSDIPSSADKLWTELNFANASAVAEKVLEAYKSAQIDKVVLVYNSFKNVATQIVRADQLLPVLPPPPPAAGSKVNLDYIFQPSKEEIVSELIPKSLKIHFYRALLESQAGEHGARMTAMHKATDNASDLKKRLTLEYNKARQAAITNEILEIVGGAEALKG